jgi:hypothetical protein
MQLFAIIRVVTQDKQIKLPLLTKITIGWMLAVCVYLIYQNTEFGLHDTSPEGISWVINSIIFLFEFIVFFFPTLLLLIFKRKIFWIILIIMLLYILFWHFINSSYVFPFFLIIPLLFLLLDSRRFWKIGK